MKIVQRCKFFLMCTFYCCFAWLLSTKVRIWLNIIKNYGKQGVGWSSFSENFIKFREKIFKFSILFSRGSADNTIYPLQFCKETSQTMHIDLGLKPLFHRNPEALYSRCKHLLILYYLDVLLYVCFNNLGQNFYLLLKLLNQIKFVICRYFL